MDFSNNSESLQKICQSIEERDHKIIENNVKIKYYNNLTEKLTSEISLMKRRTEKIDEEIAFHKEQNKYFQLIHESLEEGSKIMEKCITNHQTFEIIMSRYSKINEFEEQTVKDDFNNMYLKIKNQMEANLLFQQLEDKKVAYLKADIEHRQEAVKVKVLKAIIAQKLKIQKQIFYNYFVDLATKYVKEKLSNKQYQNIQKNIVQENSAKLNIEKQISNIENMVRSNNNIDLNQKISEILEKDSEVIIPPKIRILSEQIIVPAFQDYSKTPSIEVKYKKTDWLQKWKKRLFSKNSINTSKLQDSFVSQQSNQTFSQEPAEIEDSTNEPSHQYVDKGNITSQDVLKPLISQTLLEDIKKNENEKKANVINTVRNSQTSNIKDACQQISQTQVTTSLPPLNSTSIKENKSVHFNLTSEKEAPFNFQPLMMDNKYSSFFHKPTEGAETSMAFGNTSSNGLNLSLMDTHLVQDNFKNLDGNIQFSPEYEYEPCTELNPNFLNFEPGSMQHSFEKNQAEKPTETGTRMFTFGSSFNPFQ
ncbi:hypothetical protein GWI33_013999 [Rhynchophorus ferrugineus]|uniref:Uncharacterized protein n=1 Tax=Rhynchophorus ferrugineus TaxID=354439 RepID=A0A834I840_RHYFE|nr:hypothetical protein GWI33_013999 [Rhynchophorus ferrugineus]